MTDGNVRPPAMLAQGVGRAIVRRVEISVDCRPQRSRDEVVSALGLPSPLRTSIGNDVIGANEEVQVLEFADARLFRECRDASRARMTVDRCHCATPDDCRMYRDRTDDSRPALAPIGSCPAVVAGEWCED